MKHVRRFRLSLSLLSLAALAGGTSLGAEIDLTGRWELLAKGPEQATAVWVFEKKDQEWTGKWLIRDQEWALVDFDVAEDRVKFRITARPNSWFAGHLDPNGRLEGEIATPGGSRKVIATRIASDPEPLEHLEKAAPAAGSATLD